MWQCFQVQLTVFVCQSKFSERRLLLVCFGVCVEVRKFCINAKTQCNWFLSSKRNNLMLFWLIDV